MPSQEMPSTAPPAAAIRPVEPVRTQLLRSSVAPPDPLTVLRRLGAVGGRRVLLESAGAPSDVSSPPSIQRSVLVVRPLLQLEVRLEAQPDGHRARVRWQALEDEARPLLDRLADGCDGRGEVVGDGAGASLAVEVACASGAGTLTTDADRLRLPSPLDAVRATAGLLIDGVADRTALAPGVFGLLGHDLVDAFEELPPRRPDAIGDADVAMVLAGDFVVWDHAAGRAEVLTRGLPWEAMRAVAERHEALVARVASVGPLHRASQGGAAQSRGATARLADRDEDPGWASDVDREGFCRDVGGLQDSIRRGEVFQAVLSRGLTRPIGAASHRIYEALARGNPSPYMFHADLGEGVLLGASPEACLRVERRRVEIRPIAGTAPRGLRDDGTVDPDLDRRLGLSLLLDPKEQAEHAMLLDLARNDVARVSRPGTTEVVQQFALEPYSHVQHLVSRVRGRLRPDLDALHAYRAAANMGTLTGAPKVRAMELVRECEPQARGCYGGAFGYLLADGTFDSCIVIRSLRIRDGVGHLRVGAGIVADSVPEREWTETCHKARAVQRAVAEAEAAEAADAEPTQNRGDRP